MRCHQMIAGAGAGTRTRDRTRYTRLSGTYLSRTRLPRARHPGNRHPRTRLPDTRFSRARLLLTLLGTMAAWGCGGQGGADGRTQGGSEPGCDVAAARQVVETFGERLKNVSIMGPDSVVAAELRANYGGLVTEHLLDGWLFRPENAPGREASSPWPERIQIDTILTEGAGTCLVHGKIVYLTSLEVTHGGVAALRPVRMTVRQVEGDRWVIDSYLVTTPAVPPHDTSQAAPADGVPQRAPAAPPGTTPQTTSPATAPGGNPGGPPGDDATPGATPPDSTSPAAAADLIRRYYAAINARQYRRAYELWSDDGRASGQTFDEFAAGFAETASVEVEVGTPGRVEGAAGSRFVDVPVVIHAVLNNGQRQRFEGHYTLRRAVVEGATPEQRRWRIHSAEIRETR